MPPGELAHTLVHVERVRRLHNPPLPLSRTCGRDERRKRRAGARRSWSASAGAAPSATSPAVRGPRPPPRPAPRPPRLRLGPAAHSPCPELESAPRWAGARRSGRPSQAGQARRPRRKAAARCFRSGPQRTGARAARGRWAPPGNNALQTSPHRERKQARNSHGCAHAPRDRVSARYPSQKRHGRVQKCLPLFRCQRKDGHPVTVPLEVRFEQRRHRHHHIGHPLTRARDRKWGDRSTKG